MWGCLAGGAVSHGRAAFVPSPRPLGHCAQELWRHEGRSAALEECFLEASRLFCSSRQLSAKIEDPRYSFQRHYTEPATCTKGVVSHLCGVRIFAERRPEQLFPVESGQTAPFCRGGISSGMRSVVYLSSIIHAFL